MRKILSYFKKYPIKFALGLTTAIFMVIFGIELFTPYHVTTETNFHFRILALSVASALAFLFSRESFKALADGAITSPKGLVLGIWVTYVGIAIHIIVEELPEAFLERLNHIIPIEEHDNSLHWVHHAFHGFIDNPINMLSYFLFVMGSFLVLISSQKLNLTRMMGITIWIVFVALIVAILYHGVLLPYLGIAV